MKKPEFNFEHYDDAETREEYVNAEVAHFNGHALASVIDQHDDEELGVLLAAIRDQNVLSVGTELLRLCRNYVREWIDEDEFEDFARQLHDEEWESKQCDS